jgi:EAL domain-containing protein (putative c-di-GMP-specific phosphodiesterase class I)
MMSHKLGCKVIAEGIETKSQRDLLEQIGCDSGQGYYFSKPVPAALFEKLLIEDSALDDSAPTLRVIPAS